MSANITQIIRSFSGYTYEVAGIISGFFDSPNLAKACAESIQVRLNREVQVCGCKLSVPL
jgi:hypothetical protein